MNWLFLALFSRGFWAADNIVDKLIIGKYLKDSYVLTLISGLSPLLLSIGIIFTNKLSSLGLIPISIIFLAGAIQIIGVFGFYKALSKEEVSRVIPLFQFTPVLVVILSLIFLKEVLTVKQSIGFILILLGGFFISIKRIKGLFRLREAFWWMVLSSFVYAIQAIILKSMYVNYPFWSVTFYLGIGEFLPTLLLLSFSRNLRDRVVKGFSNLQTTGWLILILGIIFIAGANLSGLYAFRTGLVTLISVLRGFQSVFVLIFSLILSIWFPKILKEELTGGVLITKILAICLMLAGLYFIEFI